VLRGLESPLSGAECRSAIRDFYVRSGRLVLAVFRVDGFRLFSVGGEVASKYLFEEY